MYSIKYIKNVAAIDAKKKINAVFFKTPAGHEPVKEILKDLGRPTKTVAGEDIRFVELN